MLLLIIFFVYWSNGFGVRKSGSPGPKLMIDLSLMTLENIFGNSNVGKDNSLSER